MIYFFQTLPLISFLKRTLNNKIKMPKRKSVKKEQRRNGYTLPEVAVTLGIFVLLISIMVSVFASCSHQRRKISEMHITQREGNYLMETISRELRTAAKIDEDSQKGNSDSDIEFKNHKSAAIKYCRADSNGDCSATGDCLVRAVEENGDIINSSKVEISSLKFYVSKTFGLNQPVVTVSLKIKPTNSRYDTELFLQNTIVLRNIDPFSS